MLKRVVGLTCLLSGCWLTHGTPSSGGNGGLRDAGVDGGAGGPLPAGMDGGVSGRPGETRRDGGRPDRDGGRERDDAGRPQDAGFDGGSRDGGADAGVDAGDAGDAALPEPPQVEQTFPELLIATPWHGSNAVFAAGMRAPTALRRVDPEPAAIDVGAQAVSYSPDGRKLLLLRSDPRGVSNQYYVAYPCRDPGCSTSHADLVLTSERTLQAQFAPDSSGVLLSGGPRLFYAATSELSAHAAVEIPSTNGGLSPRAHDVVGGGRALVIEDTVPYLADLRTPDAAARAPVPIVEPGSAEAGLGVGDGLTSPDGEHVVFQRSDGSGNHEVLVYAVADLLAGQLAPRKLAPGTQALYASDDRLVLFADGASWAERWDGSDPVSLPLTVAGAAGCGDRLVFAGAGSSGAQSYGVFELTLPGADAPAAEPVAGELLGVKAGPPTFYRDCARVAFAPSTCSDVTIADLDTHQVFPVAGACPPSIAPNGEIYGAGPFDLQRLFRVGASAAGAAWTARVPLEGASIRYARQRSALFVASALPSATEPGLYELDLSAPDHVVERRLLPEAMNVVIGAVTRDDRYLAYSVRHAEIADPPDVTTGLFELDLQTGESRRLGPAASQALAGALVLAPIPGHRAVMINGQYRADEVTRSYACDLDSQAPCVEQLPSQAASWQVLADPPWGPNGGAYQQLPAFSSDGMRAAVNVVTPQGPGVAVVAVRLAEQDPAQLLALVVDASFNGERALSKRHDPLSFSDGLGLTYWLPQDANGAPQASRDLYVLDLQSGASRVLGEPAAGWPGATADDLPGMLSEPDQQSDGYTLIARSSATLGDTLTLVDGESGDRGVAVAQAPYTTLRVTQLPGGERVLYGIERDDDQGCELHLYEPATGRDVVIDHPPDVEEDAAGDAIGCTAYEVSADGGAVLLLNRHGHVLHLQLRAADGSWLATPVLRAMAGANPGSRSNDLTRDGRRVLLFDRDGIAALFDAARPDTLVRLRVPEGDATVAVLTPDGRFALARAHEDGRSPWYRIDLAHPDLGVVRLAVPASFWPSFDPSGQYAAFMATPSELRVIRLDAPERAELVFRAEPSASPPQPQLTWVP